MKLVRWSYNNLHMPMMSDDNGDLWCTSKQLCGALGITENSLRLLKNGHKEEFDDNCVSKTNAISFLKENKTEFGVKYVRGDMTLWSEDDMITVAILARSPIARAFRKELKTFIKQNAIKNTVSRAEHDKTLMQLGMMAVEIEELKKFVGLKSGAHRVQLQLVN